MRDEKNMTEGNVTKTILKFFFPMLCTNTLQQVYSVADTWIVGKGLGDTALASVGNAVTVSLFLAGFLQGITNGFSVIIAQNYGAGDYTRLRKSAAHSMKICTVISVLLSVVSALFLRTIFTLMHTDNSIMDGSLTYGYIIFGGLIITAAYNLCSGVLRSLGDSKTPFIAVIISSFINILLDILLIFIIGTGVGGAAAATVFSQLISVLICLIRLKKIECINLQKSDFKTDKDNTVLLLRNGLPMAFMNSVTAVGCIAVQSCVNDLGAAATSAYSVCTKYLNFFMLPGITAGFTVSAFTGQNFGAKKYDRIKKGVRTGITIAVISYILLGTLMIIFPETLAGLMLTGETPILYTSEYLEILGSTLILLNLIFIFRSAVQAMGRPTIPMLSGFAEMILRLSTIFFLIPKTGFIAAAYADLIAWTEALAMNIIAYYFLINKRIQGKKYYDDNT